MVGAGPAGLSAALALKDRGIRPLLVEQGWAVGSSWRGRYDRLRLNSSRPLSHLPGRRFPKGTPIFPTRDDMVEHLERHAREDGMDLQLGTRVDRLARDGGGWVLETSEGELRARQVVIATGYERYPLIPDWGGRDRFGGRLLHSSEYRNPGPFRGSKVLVVGAGCSGMEIAYDLAEGGAQQVWLSARTPPNIVLRALPGGVPGEFLALLLMRLPTRFADAFVRAGRLHDMGDLTEWGLPMPDEGPFARLHRTGQAPAIVDMEVIDAIKARQIEIVRGVDSLDATGVRLADGARVEPDAVVCATGYRRGLEPLVGHLGVLDEQGVPLAKGAAAASPGLRFVGYTFRPGMLGFSAREGKRAAKAIAREMAAVRS